MMARHCSLFPSCALFTYAYVSIDPKCAPNHGCHDHAKSSVTFPHEISEACYIAGVHCRKGDGGLSVTPCSGAAELFMSRPRLESQRLLLFVRTGEIGGDATTERAAWESASPPAAGTCRRPRRGVFDRLCPALFHTETAED